MVRTFRCFRVITLLPQNPADAPEGWLARAADARCRRPGGLRIDDVGEPIPPESLRDHAAAEVRAASDGLAHIETAISAAHQLASRLYVAD